MSFLEERYKQDSKKTKMASKQNNYIKAVEFGAVVFILMTLFWKLLGSFVNIDNSYLTWSWNLVRKLTTWGFTIFAFFGSWDEKVF